MTTDFDKAIRMRIFESWKWKHCDENIHPLWIADMDFKAPEPILQAVEERVNHGVFGYAIEPPELREVITQRLWELYNWPVSPEELVFLSGVMSGSIWPAVSLPDRGMESCYRHQVMIQSLRSRLILV